MSHLILLGDSIFDNRAYVDGGPAVIDLVQQRIPQEWRASLLAVDGNTSAHVTQQLGRMPPDASHLILSVGGNDALEYLNQMNTPVTNLAGALGLLAKWRKDFQTSYTGAVNEILNLKLPLMVCTIYDNVPGLTDPLKAALALFNDIIIRNAIAFGFPVLDLRMICTDPGDYSAMSPIEPSSQGGIKIADRMVSALLNHDSSTSACLIYS